MSSSHIPPTILRIKRKRNQDPLQALILEDKRGAKRSKPSTPIASPISTPIKSGSRENLNLVFTLTRTDTVRRGALDESILQSVLSESVSARIPDTATTDQDDNEDGLPDFVEVLETRKRKFIIPKNQTHEDTVIPNELSDMVNSLLTVGNESGESHRKRRTRHRKEIVDRSNAIQAQSSNSKNGDDNDHDGDVEDDGDGDDDYTESDYVYDVYQLNSSVPLTSANHPQSQIGYIRFFDDDDPNDLYQSDDDETIPATAFSDDEDSNAEDYYQNDYPSDEDAGAYSDTNSLLVDEEGRDEEEDSDDIALQYDESLVNTRRKSNVQLSDSELVDFQEGSYLPDDDYYDADEGYNDIDEDYEHEHGTTTNFRRNNFFPSDEHDPIAIHRDQIFGKLEKLLQEKE